MASSYERELRSVLCGSPEGVHAITKTCSAYEKASAMMVVKRPFLVVRAAGSGMEGSGDLVALRGDLCFPIEVKTSKDRRIYLAGRTLDQYEAMLVEGRRCGLMPLYAMRLKRSRGDSWRIFRVETGELPAKFAILARRIPAFPLTRSGRPMLDWDQGLPLHRLLALICREDSDSGSPSYAHSLGEFSSSDMADPA